MMDAAIAVAWGKLQRAMRAGSPGPRPAQLAMFEPSRKRDARALQCAVLHAADWKPPRGLGAAARRLAGLGMLAERRGVYNATAEGRKAARGEVMPVECL